MNKLKIICCTVLFSCSFLMEMSAQQYFNKIIPFEFGNPTPINLYQWNEKQIITVIYPGNVSTLVTIDSEFYDYHHFTNFDFSISSMAILNNELFSYAKNRSQAKGLQLAKLSEQFEFDWSNEIFTPGEYNIAAGTTALGDHIYTSFVYEVGGIKNIGMRKSNTDGDSIWTKYFEDNIGYSYLWDTEPTLDHNLLFSYTLRHQNENKGSPYIMKIDTSGNEIWRSTPLEVINSGAELIWFSELSDSTIIYTYRISRWGDPVFLGNNWNIYPMRMVWLNNNGERIKEDYMLSPYNEKVIVAGIEKGKGDYFFIHGEYEAAEDQFGFITKYNNQGDTIWTHKYQHPDFMGINATHYIWDIIEREDGSIMALGQIYAGGIPAEIWLFSVNSEGCFSSADCEEIVSSTGAPPFINSEKLKIFPNPASDYLSIHMEDAEMSSIEILNVQGDLLRRIELQAIRCEMDIQELPSGLYLMKVTDRDGVGFVSKFVRQ